MTKITKQQVLENLDEVKKFIQEADEAKAEQKNVCIEIKNRFTGEVKFSSEKTTIKEACVDNKADLREADLYGANLRGADLRGADLREADLYGADLRGANLYEANLRGASLRGADLYEADLMNAKFYGKGGTTKLKKSQVDDFFKALGIIVEE